MNLDILKARLVGWRTWLESQRSLSRDRHNEVSRAQTSTYVRRAMLKAKIAQLQAELAAMPEVEDYVCFTDASGRGSKVESLPHGGPLWADVTSVNPHERWPGTPPAQ